MHAAPESISILFSEGSSLSARQAISALGPLGYRIDVCDPNRLCMSRFSRFLRRFYRSPSLGKDPKAYFDFILDRLTKERYDVLLPVHEQAFLFARMQRTLQTKVGLALTPFDQFKLLQSKATFAQVMAEIGIPQPATRVVHSRAEIEAETHFPYYVKLPYSTAGRGVWPVTDASERSLVIQELEKEGHFDGQNEIIIQAGVQGVQCQAQAVFEHGRLIACHCTSQRSVGVGGSQSARLSVDHPIVRTHLSRIGEHLGWHAALTMDYFYDPATIQPVFIEANPRLVESINAVLSGVNLPDILVRLSLGESFKQTPVQCGRPGVRTHSLLATILSRALATGSRTQVAAELLQALTGHGVYEDSAEDLTPCRLDLPSIVPLSVVMMRLLVRPGLARRLSSQAVADYSLTPRAVRTICDLVDI